MKKAVWISIICLLIFSLTIIFGIIQNNNALLSVSLFIASISTRFIIPLPFVVAGAVHSVKQRKSFCKFFPYVVTGTCGFNLVFYLIEFFAVLNTEKTIDLYVVFSIIADLYPDFFLIPFVMMTSFSIIALFITATKNAMGHKVEHNKKLNSVFYCRHCGTANPYDAVFCSVCGNRFKKN